MSWGVALHSTKLVFSYWISRKVKMLRDAIFNEDVSTIQQLVTKRPKLLYQAIDGDGNTALGLAIQLNKIKVVKILLRLGSDPNMANAFDGNHPLSLLAKLSPKENSQIRLLVQILLAAGSDPFYQVSFQADHTNRFNPIKTFAFNETPLLYCTRIQNEDLLKIFIESKIDINALQTCQFINPLMLAASLGDNHICKILLDAGAEINASDYECNTPLHLAIEHDNVIQTLLEYGADKNALNEDGYTPVMLAQRLAKIKNMSRTH